ncbi:hypothetical protein HOLleu_37755 [Holothuria leucospilota]|uniref:Uncharacterized protein n=1 Tax=Holothuria leucospilota TaxID=206669 RepID=A0A9Q0YMB2_HOLLE|nr:hypothetical protein HOLleu_37755 [Holothuria leucospilota]
MGADTKLSIDQGHSDTKVWFTTSVFTGLKIRSASDHEKSEEYKEEQDKPISWFTPQLFVGISRHKHSSLLKATSR